MLIYDFLSNLHMTMGKECNFVISTPHGNFYFGFPELHVNCRFCDNYLTIERRFKEKEK